ncbi:MAG: Ig-like domain-containing protein [Candidatus Sulfotelmatobacter sp.]
MTRQRKREKKFRILGTITLIAAVLAVLTALALRARAQINPTTRTVTTTNFSVTWSTTNDTEAITTIDWMGGQNLTNTQGIGTCFPSFPGSVEYFGNSYAPPDPWAGGLVLVGGGTTTPAGTTAWSGQVLSSGADQVTINSSSTGCPPSSAGINVQTTYTFSNPNTPGTNFFAVQRAFDFTTTTFAHDFRPYMPRLSLSEGFTDVLYPDASGALETLNVYDCGLGCTGPIVIPDAVLLSPAWNATQGWFAIHNPTTLQGVVVARSPSVDPQGNPIVAQLWVDNDGGSNTNVASFLLLSPTAGFTGGTVTEVETLCFYDSSIWTPSLTPPAPCNGSASSQTPTSTTLISSLNPSEYGQTTAFTATVTSSSGTPTGTVTFYDNTTSATLGSATLISGSASISVSSLAAGTHSITAAYQGSASFNPSTSAPLSQIVNIATTTTSITSSLNPAGTNQSITLSATVTSQYGGAATGSVVFYSGSQSLGTVSLSGNRAILTTSFATAGTYSISAKYNGDGNNAVSTSSTVSQVIIAATTTTLTSSLNPSLVGQAVTFTATVSSTAGTPPNGEIVTFNNGLAVLGTAPLSRGVASFTTSSLAAGIYTITATYNGDANFAASTSPGLRQVVNSTTKSATATTLVSSLNPSIYGQNVTWTATVTTSGPVAPTGKVSFFWAGNFLSTAPLNASGVATFTRALNADLYPFTAVYVGDANNLTSTSAILNQVINEATSTATLTSSPNPSTQGQAVTFTASITSPTVLPTGPVTFTAGKMVLGTAQLSSGKAKFTTSTLPVGSTAVTATYYGDSNIAESAASVTQTVQQ